jgi:hypothetical protein
MAITNAQQYKQILQKEREEKAFGGLMGIDGRKAYVGGSYAETSPGSGKERGSYQGRDDSGGYGGTYSGGGGGADSSYITPTQEANNAAAIAKGKAEKAAADKKAAEAKAKEEKKKEKKEAKAKAKKDKRLKKMRQKAFDRFQQLEPYVNIMDEYGETGEDLAKATGFKGNIETGFEYDKDFFRDSKTGKIKDKFTEMVDINKGKTDIFGNPKEPKFVEQFKSDAIPGYDFSINPVKSNFQSGLGTLTSTGSTTKVKPNDYGIQIPTGTSFDILSNIVRPPTGLQAFNTLEEARNIGDLTTRYAGGDDSAYDEYLDLIDRTNPTTGGGGGGGGQQQDPCLGPNPPAYCAVNNDPTDPATPTRNLGGLAPRFAGSIFDFTGLANGGRAGYMDGGMMEDTPEGGIMDLESGRQMYFLGKLVKKATRAVKKIVKSPVGKAALLYFGGNALMGAGGGKGLASFFGKGSFNPLRMAAAATSDGPMTQLSPLGKILSKFGMATGEGGGKLTLGGKLGLGFGIPFALDALGIGKDKDDGFDIDEYYRKNGINIADVRNNPYNYLSARNQGSLFAANGGLMRTGYQEGGDAEPVAKKTMPLLDMDGMEKDYREDGGFVPIGRMERADDVPARLSKNEFVFTADAVRNAGEGDIDKGAEVMYNMMKNLESGGEVSEESQGLDGAKEMFKTSQRLEEVL